MSKPRLTYKVMLVMLTILIVMINDQTCNQIKYVEGDQKLMVTVERCDGLKKETGMFGGD